MFWPLILPAQITAAIVLLLATILYIVASRKKWKWQGLVIGAVALVVSAVPIFMVTMSIADRFRFGEFSYAKFDDINDFRVERYMPEAATDITVFTRSNGYRGKFSIGREDLETWHSQFWEEHGAGKKPSGQASFAKNAFGQCFGKSGWVPPDDLVEFASPAAGNGAYYVIWHSDSEGTGYITGCYW